MSVRQLTVFIDSLEIFEKKTQNEKKKDQNLASKVCTIGEDTTNL